MIRLHRYKTLITSEVLKAELLAFSRRIERQEPEPTEQPNKTPPEEFYKTVLLNAAEDEKDETLKSLASHLRYKDVDKNILVLRLEGKTLSSAAKKKPKNRSYSF